MNLFEYMVEAPRMTIFLAFLISFTLVFIAACWSNKTPAVKPDKGAAESE